MVVSSSQSRLACWYRNAWSTLAAIQLILQAGWSEGLWTQGKLPTNYQATVSQCGSGLLPTKHQKNLVWDWEARNGSWLPNALIRRILYSIVLLSKEISHQSSDCYGIDYLHSSLLSQQNKCANSANQTIPVSIVAIQPMVSEWGPCQMLIKSYAQVVIGQSQCVSHWPPSSAKDSVMAAMRNRFEWQQWSCWRGGAKRQVNLRTTTHKLHKTIIWYLLGREVWTHEASADDPHGSVPPNSYRLCRA